MMGDVLTFVNGNAGALLLIVLLSQAVLHVEVRDLRRRIAVLETFVFGRRREYGK